MATMREHYQSILSGLTELQEMADEDFDRLPPDARDTLEEIDDLVTDLVALVDEFDTPFEEED